MTRAARADILAAMAAGERDRAVVQVILAGFVMVGAAGIGARSLEREVILCARDAGTCTTTRAGPITAGSTRTIALAPVRRHEFREFVASKRRTGATVLTLENGAELRFAEREPEAARADFEALDPFFRGEVDRVELAREPGILGAVLGALVAAGAAWLCVRGARTWWRTPASAETGGSSSGWRWRRSYSLALAVALVVAAVAFVLLQTRAKLVLECAQRCEIEQMTCLPGQGEVELWTDPGDHTVRVWHPGPPESWREHTVTLVAGETTRFRCEPQP